MSTNKLPAFRIFHKQFNGRALRNLCLVILIFCSIGCSRHENPIDKIKNSYRADSLNDLILDNLRSKRIVMIGDAAHENGYYMRLVTGALDRWLDQLQKEKARLSNQGETLKRDQPLDPLPKKLILFIEADSEQTDLIRHYLQTGDITNLLMYVIHGETKWGSLPGGFSMERIEYFQNLKRIEERVQKLNTQDVSHPYDFRILGPEGIPPYDFKKTKDTTVWRQRFRRAAKGNFEYFVRHRDEVSSSTIRKMLDNNSDYKALVFYGTGHLLRGRQNKATGGGALVGIDTAYGYYLAHYLDQYFSRDSVSIFFTVHYPGAQYTRIQELEQSTTAPDYRVFCNPNPPVQCPLEILNCETTLRVLYDLMRKNSSGNSEEDQLYSRTYGIRLAYQLKRSYLNSREDIQPMLNSLLRFAWDTNRIAIKKRDGIAKKLIAKFDAVQNIISLNEWIAMPLRDSSRYLPMLKIVLTNFPPRGLVVYGSEPFANLSLNDSAKSIIKPRAKDLIEYFLVQLLWIGTPDEIKRAQKELQARTGLHLQTPREWSDWWRSQYPRL